MLASCAAPVLEAPPPDDSDEPVRECDRRIGGEREDGALSTPVPLPVLMCPLTPLEGLSVADRNLVLLVLPGDRNLWSKLRVVALEK